jgi:outer membrane protein assembly factor BamB
MEALVKTTCRRTLFGLAFTLAAAAPGAAEDWPKLLGPRGDGTSAETGLIKTWTAKGPPKLWDVVVGEGYSGPVVAGGRLVLHHRQDQREIVQCFDAATGKPLWKFDYPTQYVDNFGKGDGPRSTPVIDGGNVYTLGAEGLLHCLEMATGAKRWSVNLNTTYRPPPSFFGVGTSPLVEGDHILVNVGAKKAGIVALHKDTGKEIWKATDDGASYSTPAVAMIGGKRLAVFFTRLGVVLVEPATGKVHYSQRWRSRMDASVNAATPLVIGDLLFFSSSYNTGALLLNAQGGAIKEVWSGDDAMSNHYSTSLYHQSFVYGFDGRQEQGARLRCFELQTGKVQWTKENYGCGSMVQAAGHALVLTERGDLVSLALTPKEYRELARAPVCSALPCRAQIALSDGRLYARDAKRLICWKVSQP